MFWAYCIILNFMKLSDIQKEKGMVTLFYATAWQMVLISDIEHVGHARRKMNFSEKIRFLTGLDLIQCFKLNK